MGRRATRRRHKKKHNRQQKTCHSDPEELRESSTGNKYNEDKWDSLDDLALLDYAENAACNDPSTVNDEMEVTKRLSSLNVSVSYCGTDHHCTAIMTSDVETIYSEFPPTATLADNLPGELVPYERLKERQLRKRSSKRNRKRTKKARANNCSKCTLNETTTGGSGRNRNVSSILDPISWVRSSQEYPSGPYSDQCDCHHSSDLSSRALTDSDSPVLDDIIMIGTDPEDEPSETKNAHSELRSQLIEDFKPATPSPLYSSHTHSHGTSRDSDLSDSTSDSGCDGDDEESSAELLGNVKVTGATASSLLSGGRRGLKSWYGKHEDDGGFSSVEELFEPSDQASCSKAVKRGIMKQRERPERSADVGEFKHPLQCGMKGAVNSLEPSNMPTTAPSSNGGSGKPKKKVVHLIASPQDLNNRIKHFVQFSPELELTLPMMSRPLCRTAGSLADVYNLDCVIYYQKRRLPVASPILRKTYCTHVASNEEVEVVIDNHQQEVLNSVINPRSKSRKPTLPVHVPISVLQQTRNLVGGDAPPIGESNIGNQMLQGMGWKPGNGLGREESGMQSPVFAEVRPKTFGLGYAN